jgi:hypothetical protein
MNALKKSATRRKRKPNATTQSAKAAKRPPDLGAILDAFADARALVTVVYTAFQINGRDGPEQPVLWQVIQALDRAYDQLDDAANQIERFGERNASTSRGAS